MRIIYEEIPRIIVRSCKVKTILDAAQFMRVVSEIFQTLYKKKKLRVTIY